MSVPIPPPATAPISSPRKKGVEDRHRLSGPLSGRGYAPPCNRARQPILPAIIVVAQPAIVVVAAHVSAEITELDQQLATWHTQSEASRRLAAIPGLGIITATAIAATVTDAEQFSSGRQFAAWLGLTPRQHSTGGKTRLGGISKQGDRYLRRLLVVGATAVMRHVKDKPTPMANWIRKLSEKKPFRLVSVALANKLARIAWVVLTRKEAYHPYAHLT